MRDNNGQLIQSTSPGSLNNYSRLRTRPPNNIQIHLRFLSCQCSIHHRLAANSRRSNRALNPRIQAFSTLIAILGTLASKPDLSFKGLVDSYKDLPTEVLSTAPASYAFVKDTPGPRYLVLTAYRIEVLQYICFVSLLQNIHEVIWSITPDDGQETIHYPIKQSRTGVQFQAAAWWAPSWVEKTRIVRAYWNLFIYWNIQAISADLTAVTDDWKFQYTGRQ